MNIFIASAFGATSAAPALPAPGAFQPLFLFSLVIIIAYFLFYRPNSQRVKRQRALLKNLKESDEVLLESGFFGKIVTIGSDYFLVEIAKGTNVKVKKDAIRLLLPKGTIRNEK